MTRSPSSSAESVTQGVLKPVGDNSDFIGVIMPYAHLVERGRALTSDSRSAETPSRVTALRAHGFRNLQSLAFEPGSHFNVIHGDNGAGKSNLLEAIYYLGALKSFRGAKTDDLIALDSDSALLEATLEGGPAPHKLRIDVGRSQRRRLQLDGKRPRSTSLWHQTVRMVLFHPGDLILASGAPDKRRAFLDRMLEQMDPIYGSTLASYEKALRSRNRLLKEERTDRRSVRAYDAILSKAGAVVGQARRRLIDDLAPRVVRAFSDVFAGDTPLGVRYLPRVEPTEELIAEALERSFDKDRARGFNGGRSPRRRPGAAAASGRARAIMVHRASTGRSSSLSRPPSSTC